MALPALLLLAGACVAQVRNGDQIARDPYLSYAPENVEFLQLAPDEVRRRLESPANAAQWNDRAVAEARLQHLDLAEAGFQQAIQMEPTHSLAYFNLSRLYVLVAEPERARSTYLGLLQSRALGGGELFTQATDMAGAGRHEEATILMEALASIDIPAVVREESGGATVIQSSPPLEAALWLAADAMHQLDYARARHYFDRVLAVDALEARALFGRGYIGYLAEDWDGAAELLGLAQRARSQEPGLPYLLTRALFEQDRYDEALAVAGSTQNPTLELLALHGRIRLIQDYRADLSELLAQAVPADRATLLRLWYGSAERRPMPELPGEFELLY